MSSKTEEVTLTKEDLDKLLAAATESGRAIALLEDKSSTSDRKTPYAILERNSIDANKALDKLYVKCMKRSKKSDRPIKESE